MIELAEGIQIHVLAAAEQYVEVPFSSFNPHRLSGGTRCEQNEGKNSALDGMSRQSALSKLRLQL
jgi:hypothetical protein